VLRLRPRRITQAIRGGQSWGAVLCLQTACIAAADTVSDCPVFSPDTTAGGGLKRLKRLKRLKPNNVEYLPACPARWAAVGRVSATQHTEPVSGCPRS
jgi:hypothetical protein